MSTNFGVNLQKTDGDHSQAFNPFKSDTGSALPEKSKIASDTSAHNFQNLPTFHSEIQKKRPITPSVPMLNPVMRVKITESADMDEESELSGEVIKENIEIVQD